MVRIKIYSNKIRCKYCGDIIESKHVHDFKYCSCGKCAVDGGLDYLRRLYDGPTPEEVYEELSDYESDVDEFFEDEEPDEEPDEGYDCLYKNEKIDDLISRQDAIDALYNASEDLSDNMWSVNTGVTCEKMVEILNNLPSAKLPKGEWVLEEEQSHVELMYRCSECGFIAWGEYEKTNYCPNCGTRMTNA